MKPITQLKWCVIWSPSVYKQFSRISRKVCGSWNTKFKIRTWHRRQGVKRNFVGGTISLSLTRVKSNWISKCFRVAKFWEGGCKEKKKILLWKNTTYLISFFMFITGGPAGPESLRSWVPLRGQRDCASLDSPSSPHLHHHSKNISSGPSDSDLSRFTTKNRPKTQKKHEEMAAFSLISTTVAISGFSELTAANLDTHQCSLQPILLRVTSLGSTLLRTTVSPVRETEPARLESISHLPQAAPQGGQHPFC